VIRVIFSFIYKIKVKCYVKVYDFIIIALVMKMIFAFLQKPFRLKPPFNFVVKPKIVYENRLASLDLHIKQE
jgi:hypothetical protein